MLARRHRHSQLNLCYRFSAFSASKVVIRFRTCEISVEERFGRWRPDGRSKSSRWLSCSNKGRNVDGPPALTDVCCRVNDLT